LLNRIRRLLKLESRRKRSTRVWQLAAFLLTASIFGLVIYHVSHREPIIRGQPLNGWLEELRRSRVGQNSFTKYSETLTLALGADGNNAAEAIPTLTKSSTQPGITGRVTLRGRSPPEIAIDLRVDPRCGQLNPNGLTTRHYVVSPNGGLAHVFVYIQKGLEGNTVETTTNAVVLEAIRCQWEPYVIGVRTGQPLLFKNSDPVMHNIHWTSKLNREWNAVLMARDSGLNTIEKVFSKSEPFIRIKGDTFPWMVAYICVVDHAFFAVTDKEGRFSLPAGIPNGKYTIVAHHPKAGEAVQEITIREGMQTDLEFTLSVPPTE